MKIRKALTLVTALALTAALAVGGTLAYLTDTKTVTNTFTVGDVTITLEETEVDVYGDALTGDDAGKTSEGNEYKLIPGHAYTKDPIVTVEADSEDCYVFVKIENGIADIEDSNNTIASQVTTNGWTALTDVEGVYYKTVDASEEDQELTVFETFKIDSNANLSGYNNGATIGITAYAIQADGFDTAAAAWEAGGFGTTTTTVTD
jgi:predicted ribosomally synthesized peptide with SipW-like signal peptide